MTITRRFGIALLTLVAVIAYLGATFGLNASSRAVQRTVGAGELTRATSGPAAVSASSSAVRHLLYVFPDGEMDVYDIDHGHRRVARVSLPGIVGIRGVLASPRTRTLFISYGSDRGPGSNGRLAAFDLSGRQLWTRRYATGIDSPAINSRGTRIYMPDGEVSRDGTWNVIDAGTGAIIGSIGGGLGPHNTVIGQSGRRVYLGGRNSSYLDAASTRTNRVVRRIGPLRSGVRPFTVNGRETLAFTTATGFLGFQVSSIRSGHVLYTRTFGARFRYDPATFAPSAPSHGISLSPDERRLWVIDAPNSYIHVFDVSRLPRSGPREVANIRLPHPLTGTEAGCNYDCARDGWLLHSRSGCEVYVGDSGDVIDTRTLRPVAFLPALRDTRKFIEIDWRGSRPIATTSRTGLGYVRRGTRRSAQSCR